MATLLDKSQQILDEKNAKIVPANIKKGVQIFDVTGTLEELTINNQDKTVTPTIASQSIVADEGYTGLGEVTVEAVDSTIDNNIVAENIKEGVEILGVTGTLTSGGGGSVEGVKMFNTVEEMQNDPTAETDDFAVVYGEDKTYLQPTDTFSALQFPATVVLPIQITESCYASFMPVDTSYWGELSLSLAPNYFNCYYMGEKEIYIRYDSTDGITYNRTEGTGLDAEDIADFGMELAPSYTDDWGNLSYFLFTSTKRFDGMFQYKTLTDYNQAMMYGDFSQLSDNTIQANASLAVSVSEEINNVCEVAMNIAKSLNATNGQFYALFKRITNSNWEVYFTTLENSYVSGVFSIQNVNVILYTDGKTYPCYRSDYTLTAYRYNIDPINKTYTKLSNGTMSNVNTNGSYKTYRFSSCPINAGEYVMSMDFSSGKSFPVSVFRYVSGTFNASTVRPNGSVSYLDVTKYYNVPSQLNALPYNVKKGTKAYSSNGVLEGTNTGGEVKLFNDLTALNEDKIYEGDKALLWSGEGALEGLYEATAVGDRTIVGYCEYLGVDTANKTFKYRCGYADFTDIEKCFKYLFETYNIDDAYYINATYCFEGLDENYKPINPKAYVGLYNSNAPTPPWMTQRLLHVSYRPDGALDFTSTVEAEDTTTYYEFVLNTSNGTATVSTKTGSTIRAGSVSGRNYRKYVDLTDAQRFFTSTTYRPDGFEKGNRFMWVYDTGSNSTYKSGSYDTRPAGDYIYQLIEGTDAAGSSEQVEELQAQLAQVETDTTAQTTVVETQTTSLNELATLANEKLV